VWEEKEVSTHTKKRKPAAERVAFRAFAHATAEEVDAKVLRLVMLLGRHAKVPPDEFSLRTFVGKDWAWAELEARARELMNPAKMELSTKGEAMYWAEFMKRVEMAQESAA